MKTVTELAQQIADQELLKLMPQQMRKDLAAAARGMTGSDSPIAVAACRIILNRHAIDLARSALAKWGTQ